MREPDGECEATDMPEFDLTRLTSSGLIERLEFHQSLPSTNDRAAFLAAEEFLACPALVVASEQTAGRGRGGNKWWSAAGGLMFSLVLAAQSKAPNVAPSWQGFSLTAGLAICEALEQLCPHAHFNVKWPNDVYANERKICGILIESPAQARGRLIVGVGVNVNNSFASAPAELQRSALALIDIDGRDRNLTEVLLTLLQHLSGRMHESRESGFAVTRSAWQQRSLLTGRTVTLQAGQQTHIGRCLGIDEMGALLLQTQDGCRAFPAGSIAAFE
jgi:BirA family biotin operon repressor/biotin-[acetyl-CoA-carboxylase] ligase